MLSGSEARNTGLSITAHCDFAERNMDFESILEEILLGRGQGNLKLKGEVKIKMEYFFLHQICSA